MSPTCPVVRNLWVPPYLPINLSREQILSLLIWLSGASAEKQGVKALLESWKGYRGNSSHLKSPQPHLTAEGLRVLSNCIKSVWTANCFSSGTNPFQPLPGWGDLDWCQRFSTLWNSFLRETDWNDTPGIWEGSFVWEEMFVLCNKVTHWASGAVDSGNWPTHEADITTFLSFSSHQNISH